MPSQNHPFSKSARHINQWLYNSMLLTLTITTASALNMGRFSIFSAPALAILTLLHHITTLALVARDRKRTPEQLENTTAPTATRANVFFCWLLSFMWLAVACVVLAIFASVMNEGEIALRERVAVYAEMGLECLQFVVVGYVAVQCERQRRMTVRPTLTIIQRQQHMNQV